MENKIKRFLKIALVLMLVVAMLPQITIGAKAADTKTIYLDAGGSSLWDQGGAWFVAWTWGGSTADEWKKFEATDESGVYQISIPSDRTGMKLLRMSSVATTPSWTKVDGAKDGYWNNTGDLTISGTNNLYTITGWNETDGSWSHKHIWSNGTCTVCNTECAHSWDEGVTYPATCYSGRYTIYTCTVCDATKMDGPSTPLFHKWDNKDGICARENCDYECSHASYNISGVCDTCGMTCAHASHDTDGKCAVCEKEVGHNYVEGTCDTCGAAEPKFESYVVVPEGITAVNVDEKFGTNTVTDGTNYYATLQAAVEAVSETGGTLYCKPGADVGSLQHAPVCSTLTIYGNGASVTGGAERDFDIGNTDPSGGKDITADMTLTVKHLNGCGAWGAKATEHTVNLVFENCKNMGKVFITGTTGTLNITMTDCTFEGVIKEAVYSNADGAISLTRVDFSNLNKAINLNHKAAGAQTVVLDGCSFTNCGNDVSADQIPVRVLSSVEGGTSTLTVSGCSFSGTPEGGADILLDQGVGTTTAAISSTAANVTVEQKDNTIETTTTVEDDKSFSNVCEHESHNTDGICTDCGAPVEHSFADGKCECGVQAAAYIGTEGYESLQAAIDAVKDGETIVMQCNVTEEVVSIDKGIAFTIDGKDFDFTGKFYLTTGEKLTIQNVNFVATDAISPDYFIDSFRGNSNCVLKVLSCTFTDTDYSSVAVGTKQPTSVLIEECDATGVHSLLQNQGGYNVTVKSTTVEGARGMALGTVKGATVDKVTIEAADNKYGIRLDGEITDNTITIKDTTISAFIPVVVRDADVDNYTVSFVGTNTMTPANEDGHWCAIADVEYEQGVTTPTVGKQVTVELHDLALNPEKIYGNFNVKTYVARIGETDYQTLEAAIAAVKDGETIKLLADVEIDKTLDISHNGDYDEPKYTITIDGADHTITASENWSGKWMADIAWNVNLKNITFDGNNMAGVRGVQFYTSTSTMENVTFKNLDANSWGVAVQANTSDLTVKGNVTFENCAYGYIAACVGNGLPENITPATKVDTTACTSEIAVDVDGAGVTVVAGETTAVSHTEAKIGNTYYATFAEAIAAAKSGDTVTVISDLELTTSHNVPAGVTVTSAEGVKITTATHWTFVLNEGSVLKGLTVVQPTVSGAVNTVYMNSGSKVEGCSFTGQYGIEGNDTNCRAIEVAPGATGIVITGNTFENVRQPAYVNNGVTGEITNNYVDGTKGWVICSDSNVEKITGNTFGTNAVDICIIASGNVDNYAGKTVELSKNNDNATVENQVEKTNVTEDGKLVVKDEYTVTGELNMEIVLADPNATVKGADDLNVTTSVENDRVYYNETTGTWSVVDTKVEYVNMTLEDSFSLNFWVKKSELKDGTTYTAKLTNEAGEHTYVDVKTCGTTTYKGEEYYEVAYNGLAAKQMGDVIIMQVYANDVPVSNPVTDSLKANAEWLIENTDDEKLKIAMIDMLNYGAAAQKEFGYNTDNLANAGIAGLEGTTSYELPNAWTNVDGIGYGSNLELKNEIILHVWYKAANVATVKVNGVAVDADKIIDRMPGVKSVAVTDLAVANGFDTVTVEFFDASGNSLGIVEESVASYLKYMMDKSSDSNGLYDATAKFITSAYNYFPNN